MIAHATKYNLWFAITLVLGIVFPIGCSPYGENDKASIKSNYIAFRDALITNDTTRARSLVAYDFQSLPIERLQALFGDIVQTNFALTSKSYIEFDGTQTNRAWLWPGSGLKVGTHGFGFTKETNGWRINGEVMFVSD